MHAERQRSEGRIARSAREPLVQFLAIALALFAANQWIRGADPRPSGEDITISRGRVLQLAESYRLLAGRPPSRAELQALIDDFADEEVAYREAVAMGLDADDTIVRRRMRQKIEFLAEDAEASEEPSEAQLAAWLRTHKAEYRLPARVAFRQVLASRDVHGRDASAHMQSVIRQLRAGADPTKLGDPSMLPSAMPLTTQQGIAVVFGEGFAAAVLAHKDGNWFGPIDSPLGSHTVLVLSREPAREPDPQEIREKLRSDWIEARRRQTREAFQARLRQRYRVSVQWPELYAGQPAPLNVKKLQRPLDTIDSSGE